MSSRFSRRDLGRIAAASGAALTLPGITAQAAGRGTRILRVEPKGEAPALKRWPSERAKGLRADSLQLTCL